MIDGADVELVEGDPWTEDDYGWDARLSKFVEWNPHEWEVERRGWLVWRGEPDWPVTPELVERAWALYRIGLRIPFEARADLRDIVPQLRVARSLWIAVATEVTGYEVLSQAVQLEELVIASDETAEDADLSALVALREYQGWTFGRWGSVLRLPALRSLSSLDEITGQIEAPVKELWMGDGTGLPALSHPERVQSLTVRALNRFDLNTLLPLRRVHRVEIGDGRLSGLAALAKLPELRELTLEGRTDESDAVLADIAALDAQILLKPGPVSPGVLERAVQRDWVIDVSDRVLRAAYKEAGRPWPYDW